MDRLSPQVGVICAQPGKGHEQNVQNALSGCAINIQVDYDLLFAKNVLNNQPSFVIAHAQTARYGPYRRW